MLHRGDVVAVTVAIIDVVEQTSEWQVLHVAAVEDLSVHACLDARTKCGLGVKRAMCVLSTVRCGRVYVVCCATAAAVFALAIALSERIRKCDRSEAIASEKFASHFTHRIGTSMHPVAMTASKRCDRRWLFSVCGILSGSPISASTQAPGPSCC